MSGFGAAQMQMLFVLLLICLQNVAEISFMQNDFMSHSISCTGLFVIVIITARSTSKAGLGKHSFRKACFFF